jgi:6-phosphogluconolactonase
MIRSFLGNLLLLGLASSVMASSYTPAHSTFYPIYVTGAGLDKVATLHFTPPNKLELIAETVAAQDPSWITLDSHSTYAYVHGTNLSVIELDQHGKQTKEVGSKRGYPIGGDEAVASCLVNNCLFVANYMSGSASIIPISRKDHLPSAPPKIIQYTRNGIGPVTKRQDHSYAHDATASPDGGWVYVCDLGSDEIHHIKVNKHDCLHSEAQKDSTKLAEGSGPRHLTFSESKENGKQYAYLASELACTLTAFSHDPMTGELTRIGQPLLTVPKGTPLGGSLTDGPQRTTAEVVVSPDGRFVYVSNRGDDVEDHISIFSRSTDGAALYLNWVPSGGKMPRHFSMSKDGKYLAIAHEKSDNVVILERDPHSGSLKKTGAVVSNIKSPQFAGFYPPQPTV